MEKRPTFGDGGRSVGVQSSSADRFDAPLHSNVFPFFLLPLSRAFPECGFYQLVPWFFLDLIGFRRAVDDETSWLRGLVARRRSLRFSFRFFFVFDQANATVRWVVRIWFSLVLLVFEEVNRVGSEFQPTLGADGSVDGLPPPPPRPLPPPPLFKMEKWNSVAYGDLRSVSGPFNWVLAPLLRALFAEDLEELFRMEDEVVHWGFIGFLLGFTGWFSLQLIRVTHSLISDDFGAIKRIWVGPILFNPMNHLIEMKCKISTNSWVITLYLGAQYLLGSKAFSFMVSLFKLVNFTSLL